MLLAANGQTQTRDEINRTDPNKNPEANKLLLEAIGEGQTERANDLLNTGAYLYTKKDEKGILELALKRASSQDDIRTLEYVLNQLRPEDVKPKIEIFLNELNKMLSETSIENGLKALSLLRDKQPELSNLMIFNHFLRKHNFVSANKILANLDASKEDASAFLKAMPLNLNLWESYMKVFGKEGFAKAAAEIAEDTGIKPIVQFIDKHLGRDVLHDAKNVQILKLILDDFPEARQDIAVRKTNLTDFLNGNNSQELYKLLYTDADDFLANVSLDTDELHGGQLTALARLDPNLPLAVTKKLRFISPFDLAETIEINEPAFTDDKKRALADFILSRITQRTDLNPAKIFHCTNEILEYKKPETNLAYEYAVKLLLLAAKVSKSPDGFLKLLKYHEIIKNTTNKKLADSNFIPYLPILNHTNAAIADLNKLTQIIRTEAQRRLDKQAA